MEEIVEVAKIKIKILKCSQPTFWYKNKIGQDFTIIDISGRDYYVFYNGSCFGVLIVDAKVLK
jgi:hypothetical protein